jgi:hypothetical protein
MSTSEPRIMRAKFKNLKLRALGKPETVKCELEVELRSSQADPQRFFLHWKFSGRMMYGRSYTLVKAQHMACRLFEEQLEPWAWVPGEQS